MQPEARFYSIDFAGDFKEYDSLENAIKPKGLLVVIEEWEAWKNLAFGVTYSNKLYKYSFYQNNTKNKHAEVGPSKLFIKFVFRGNASNSSYDRDNIHISFSDANGLLVEPKENYGVRITGISKAIKYLLEINSKGDYEKYLLIQENEKLRKRIQDLEQIINSED